MYAYNSGSMVGTGEAADVTVPAPRAFVASQRQDAPSGYGARGPNWAAIGAITALHVVALVALVKMDVITIAKPKAEPLVVSLLAEPPAPPPEQKTQPKQEPKVQPTNVAPPPIVQTNAPPPVVVQTAPVAPSRAVPVAPPAPPPSGPVAASNLDDSVIEGKPPQYPMESRRKKEQGTVLLRLTIGTNGSVSSISIAKSSGFDRLDDAALRAVRNWRWKPMTREGQAVEVTGVMAIPFVIKV